MAGIWPEIGHPDAFRDSVVPDQARRGLSCVLPGTLGRIPLRWWQCGRARGWPQGLDGRGPLRRSQLGGQAITVPAREPQSEGRARRSETAPPKHGRSHTGTVTAPSVSPGDRFPALHALHGFLTRPRLERGGY